MCFILVTATCSRVEGSGLEMEAETLSEQRWKGRLKVIHTTYAQEKQILVGS
jgi:hypothetical protein